MSLFSIFLFIVILISLVIVHEVGHFLAAKALGVRVDEFAFGFPPRLFSKKIGETEFGSGKKQKQTERKDRMARRLHT